MREVRQQTDSGKESSRPGVSHFALQVAQNFERPSDETKVSCCMETLHRL